MYASTRTDLFSRARTHLARGSRVIRPRLSPPRPCRYVPSFAYAPAMLQVVTSSWDANRPTDGDRDAPRQPRPGSLHSSPLPPRPDDAAPGWSGGLSSGGIEKGVTQGGCYAEKRSFYVGAGGLRVTPSAPSRYVRPLSVAAATDASCQATLRPPSSDAACQTEPPEASVLAVHGSIPGGGPRERVPSVDETTEPSSGDGVVTSDSRAAPDAPAAVGRQVMALGEHILPRPLQPGSPEAFVRAARGHVPRDTATEGITGRAPREEMEGRSVPDDVRECVDAPLFPSTSDSLDGPRGEGGSAGDSSKAPATDIERSGSPQSTMVEARLASRTSTTAIHASARATSPTCASSAIGDSLADLEQLIAQQHAALVRRGILKPDSPVGGSERCGAPSLGREPVNADESGRAVGVQHQRTISQDFVGDIIRFESPLSNLETSSGASRLDSRSSGPTPRRTREEDGDAADVQAAGDDDDTVDRNGLIIGEGASALSGALLDPSTAPLSSSSEAPATIDARDSLLLPTSHATDDADEGSGKHSRGGGESSHHHAHPKDGTSSPSANGLKEFITEKAGVGAHKPHACAPDQAPDQATVPLNDEWTLLSVAESFDAVEMNPDGTELEECEGEDAWVTWHGGGGSTAGQDGGASVSAWGGSVDACGGVLKLRANSDLGAVPPGGHDVVVASPFSAFSPPGPTRTASSEAARDNAAS